MLEHEFGESFLRMAMSWPRVLQNGLEGSQPSTGSFARNKYVWPRFWPEKHHVRGENMHDDELVAQAGHWPEGLWPIASSNADYRDSIILSMLHRRLVQVLFFHFFFLLFFVRSLTLGTIVLASKHLFYIHIL